MLSRALLVGLPVALVLVACSSDRGGAGTGPHSGGPPADDPGAADDSDPSASTQNVCSTLDYGHARSNDEYFLTFADDAAVMEYSKGFLLANGEPEAKEVSHDERFVRLVAEVYEGFRTVFPRETAGLTTPPRVVVVNADGVNAFAGFDERPEVNKAPWIFWIHSGLVSSSKRDSQIKGLFAHELGHLILRNLLPETRDKIRRHYRVTDGAEKGILGAASADDPTVREHVEAIRSISAEVGRDVLFGSLPLSPFALSRYRSMLTRLMNEKEQSTDQAACNDADDGLNQIGEIIQPRASIHDYTIHLSSSEKAQVSKLTQSTAASLKKCYGHVKQSLFELKLRDRVANLPAEEARGILERALDPTTEEHRTASAELMKNDVERKVDAEAGESPTIDRLLSVVQTLHRRLSELESDDALPVDELRVFDMEEDADDAAVRVMVAIGEDPLANGRLLAGLLPDPDECYRLVERGRVPDYGRFVDPHNATCWRWFHTNQFAKALDRCPRNSDKR